MYRESRRIRRRRAWAERQIIRVQNSAVGWTAEGRGPGWRMVGPAFVAAIAYVDPGNVATNTAAGSSYGFLLLWVVVGATVMAAPVQYLAARLGILTGHSLPHYVAARARSRGTRLAYWVQAEAVAIATDVAEIVGAAVALHLLFGMDLVVAGLLSGVVAMLLLALRDRLGPRFFEGVCLGSLVLIGLCFVFGIAQVPPSPVALAEGLVPGFDGAETVLLAAGIVGATVMPHAVYLHSALAAAAPTPPTASVRARLRATRWDVGVAMSVAGTVNISMLVLGATALASGGGDSLDSAASTLGSTLGSAASTAFAVALLVSGIASTAVGTHAGAVIMKGLVRRQVTPIVRRALTLVPALVLLASAAEPLHVLVYSQVVLAFGLPFALVPLVHASFVHRPDGSRNGVAVVGVGLTAMVLALDAALIYLLVV